MVEKIIFLDVDGVLNYQALSRKPQSTSVACG